MTSTVTGTTARTYVDYNEQNDRFGLQDVDTHGRVTTQKELTRAEVNDILRPLGLKVGANGSEVSDEYGKEYPWTFYQEASSQDFSPRLPTTHFSKGAEMETYELLQSMGQISTMTAHSSMFEIFFEMLKSEKLQAHSEGMIAIAEFSANISMLIKEAQLELEKIQWEQKNAQFQLAVSCLSGVCALAAGKAAGTASGAAAASSASGLVSSGANVLNKCTPGMPQYEIDVRTVALKWANIIAKENEEMKRDAEKQADAATSFFKQILDQIKKISEFASGREFKLF